MRETNVLRLVEEQAAARPDALAVSSGAIALSYRDLDERANSVAAALRARSGGHDAPIALFAKSSAELIVGALGIMKAGVPYLPIDPAYPAQRVAFILNDAGVRIVVTAGGAGGQLPAGSWSVIDVGDRRLPANQTLSRSTLAYLIYTSGSTGEPKGVAIGHDNLLNLVTWHREAFGVTSDDRATQIAGVGFDAAVWEIWPYLTAGASLHIPDEAIRNEPDRLRDWLLAERITISFLPTVLAERIVTLDWPADARLRVMLTGGDTLHHYPPAGLPFTLVNNYGPTECTVVATSGPVPCQGTAGLPSRPTIGKAIRRSRVYVLDEQLNPVAPGASGELYIGGANVGRGYVNQPELTAQRFVADPFSDRPGGRMYKTGDRCCMLPNDEIAFVGRTDDQIKVRGHRIEPAEIVTALTQHPAIAGAAVIARDAGSGGTQLVAYIVRNADGILTYGAVREHLRTRIPEYMIPAVVVVIDRLPVNQHGKFDRAALPQPTAANTLTDGASRPARSPVEARVIDILKSLLKIDDIGADDNFFQLGGHSLLGAEVLARVRDTMGVDLSLRTIFDHPTASGIAVEIEKLIVAKMTRDAALRAAG